MFTPRPHIRRISDLVQQFYLNLVSDERLWSADRYQALNYICEYTSKFLKISRVSVWNMNDTDSIYCLSLYNQQTSKHEAGLELSARDFPLYFSALQQSRIIDANDAVNDNRTREFAEPYLKPLGIGAMLDATIRTAGKTSGVICMEHAGGARLWSADEQSAALTLADLVAQLFLFHDMKEAIDRYEGILTNMPSAAYRCLNDDDWTMIYISPGIKTITGYAPAEFIDSETLSFTSIIHPEDQLRIQQIIDANIQDHQDFEIEYRIQHRDGSLRWVSEYGRAVCTMEGEIAFIDGVINDITQQKIAEKLQHEQETIILHLLQGLSGSSGEAFFNTLTEELAQALDVDYAFIGKYHKEETAIVSTVSVYAHGQQQANFSYELSGTPCNIVIEEGICCYPENVQHYFPDDHMLIEMGIESYLGTYLQDAQGNTLGILVVLHGAKLTNHVLATNLLKIFAVRASTELERQIVEENLRNSQHHYQSLFESAGDAIFLLRDGIFVDCNPVTLEMFGCRREEIIGHNLVDFSPRQQPDGSFSQQKAAEKIQAALAGQRQHFTWQHCQLDGSLFDAEVTLSKIDSSQTPQLLAVVHDVSASKQAQALIDKQSAQLRASIEVLPGFYYMFDQSGNLVYANSAYMKLFNLTADDFFKFQVDSRIYADDIDRVQSAIQQVFSSGESTILEMRITNSTGRVIPLLATGARVILDSEPYLVGAAIDISERVATQEKLITSQLELEKSNQTLQIINNLSSKLHGLLDEKQIYQQIVNSLANLPGSPMVLIFSPQENSTKLPLISAANLPSKLANVQIEFPTEGSLAGVVIQRKCIQAVNSIEDDSRQILEVRQIKSSLLGATSEICIPLLVNKQVISVISILYQQQQNFTSLDMETFATIGKNISTSVANAQHTSELQYRAMHDSLTGLPNRAALNKELKAILNSNKKDILFSLMLIDLDRFKEVNDTLGHNIGDKLICTIGPRITDILHDYDVFLSRLGGDEFALLVRDLNSAAEIKQLAQYVLDAIHTPFVIDEIALELGASIGVATCHNTEIDEHELLRRADVAMYNVKNMGGGYCIYTPDIDTHSREKLSLMTELHYAMLDEQFILHYQPKLDLHNNVISGFEALVRWQHPERGLVYPDQFIELMEMNQLIHPLTELVLRSALLQLKSWQDRGLQFSVAVNVSPRNLLDYEFPARLSKLLTETGAEPSMLELEITENALIIDPLHVKGTLESISALGVKLSIDDFGTGYSSLAYLKQLPIDSLKIDRSFVMDMESTKHDEVIVNSTITLAHNLGLEVIAEGVETITMLNTLKKLQCDIAQGYYISRPVPADQINDFLEITPYY